MPTGGGGVSLGGFSFNVNAQTGGAQAAMQGLQQQAQQTATILRATLSAKAAIDTAQANRELAVVAQHAAELQALTGKTVVVKISTEEAQRQLTSLQQAQEAATRGLFRGAGLGSVVPLGAGFSTAIAGAALAAAAVQKVVTATKDAIEGAIQYNIRMETLTTQFRVFAGSAKAAAEIVDTLRHNADVTPFNTEEVLQSGQVFLRVAQGSQAEMLKLVNLAEQLAATNPLQGLQGATFAIGELLAGQVESIANRFNASRAAIQKFKEDGLTGIQLIEAVVKSVGGSAALVEQLSKTFEGRFSTVKSILQDVLKTGVEPLFTRFSALLGIIGDDLQSNQSSIKAWAVNIGNSVGFVLDRFDLLINSIKTLKEINDLPDKIQNRFDQGFNNGSGPQASAANEASGVDVIPEYQEQKKLQTEINSEIARRQAQETNVEKSIKVVNALLSEQKLKAAEISAEYANQNATLQHQINVINQPNFARQAQQSSLDEGLAHAGADAFVAGPSKDASAALAAQRVLTEEHKKILDIQVKRVQLAQQEYEINHRGRTALEEQAKAASEYVQVVQERNRINAQTRQDEVEALREVQRSESELRSTRLEGLQERLRGEAEYRDVALQALHEIIRLERERRDDAQRAIQEARQDADALYEQQSRDIQRAHAAEDRAYQEKIQHLQDILSKDKLNQDNKLKNQIQELDNEKRIADEKRAIRDAERSVRSATTITGEIGALGHLKDLQEQQAFEDKKAALQEKQRQQQEADTAKREAIQKKIDALQMQQREVDKKFQAEQEARQIAREKEMEVRRLAERAEANAERLKQRQEDEQIRAETEANKIADRAASDALFQAREKDRLADRAAQDAMKALQENLALKARADQDALNAAQTAATQLQKAAEEESYQRNLANQIAVDNIKKQGIADERALLDAEEAAAKSQNIPGLAAAEATRTRLAYESSILGFEAQIEDSQKRQATNGLAKQLADNKLAEEARLLAVGQITSQYELDVLRLKTAKDEIDAIVIKLDTALNKAKDMATEISNAYKKAHENDGAGNSATGSGPFTPDIGEGIGNLAEGAGKLAAGFFEGLSKAFNGANDFTALINYLNKFKKSGEDALEIGSPSKWSERLGIFIVEGFTAGITAAGANIGVSFANIFQGAWALAAPIIDAIISETNNRMNALYTVIMNWEPAITAALQAPFTTFINNAAQYNTDFATIGNNAAVAWVNGWEGNNGNTEHAVNDSMDYIVRRLFPQYKNAFETWGWNLGIEWINGWNNAMSHLTIPDVGAMSAGASFAGRAIGGDVNPGTRYKINEGQQYGEFYATGKIIPPEAFAREVAGALGGQMGSSGRGLSVQVTVANGAINITGDVDGRDLGQHLGQAIAHTVVSELRSAQKRGAHPVPSRLPGALY